MARIEYNLFKYIFIIFVFAVFFLLPSSAQALKCGQWEPGNIYGTVNIISSDEITVKGTIDNGSCTIGCFVQGWLDGRMAAENGDPIERLDYLILGPDNQYRDGNLGYKGYGDNYWFLKWPASPTQCVRPDSAFWQSYQFFTYIIDAKIPITGLGAGNYTLKLYAYYDPYANQWFEGTFYFTIPEPLVCVDCPSYWTTAYQCSGYTFQQEYMNAVCSNNTGCGSQCVDGSCSYSPTWYDSQYCDSDHYADNYRCSGTMVQREWWVAGCRMDWGGCYDFAYVWIDQAQCPTPACTAYQPVGCSGNSVLLRRTCYTATCTGAGVCGSTSYTQDTTGTDCGGSYWVDAYTCSGSMIRRLYVSAGCSGSSCYANVGWQNWQECYSDYWTNEYRCSGTMVQRKYISRGCSGGGCYSNVIWYNWSECGSDYWGDSYTCSGTMQQRLYYSRGCSGVSCYNNASWQNWSECGGDYWTNEYRCNGTMQQRKYISRGCSGTSCYSNTIWYDWSSCGGDYWGGSYTCSGTMQQRQYFSQGCSGTSCYSNPSWQNWAECGSDYWTSNYQCSGSMLQRQYYSRGCSGGNCYSNPSWQNNTDCGSDYWTNEYRCNGTMQQRKYISRGCSGTSCYSNIIWYDWSSCGGDYWGSLYSCNGDWRTRQYFSRGCSGTSCYGPTSSYPNWENCNTYDGWYGSQLRDYYCSAGACIYSGNFIPNVPTLIAPPHNTWINYNPTFQAQVSDPDNNQVRAYFNILSYADYWGSLINSGGTSSYGAINLGNCNQYWWRTYAQDSGGLTSGWSGSWLAKVDKDNPPNPTISYPTGTIEYSTFTVTLTESDACSGIATGEVSVGVKPQGGGWGSWKNCDQNNCATTINDFSYTGIDKSTYKFQYRVKDNAGNWSAWASGGNLLIDLNDPPTATNPIVTPSSVCDQPAQSFHFNWTYNDPEADTQSQFDFQVDNNSNFSSPEVNRTQTGLSYPNGNTNTQALSLATSQLPDYLTYNKTYYWRARVYDAHGLASSWVNGASFTTPIHHYPLVSFTWTPNPPNVNETTQFTDTSKCWDEDVVNGADCSTTTGDTYSWTLNGATPATSVAESLTAKFTNPGSYNATLQVTDRDGHTCSVTQTVRVSYPLPKWKEIKPW